LIVILVSVVFLVAGFAAFYWATLRLGERPSIAVRVAGIGGVGIFVAGFAASDLIFAAPAVPVAASAAAPAAPVVVIASGPQDVQIGPDLAVIDRLPRLNRDAIGSIDQVRVRKTFVAPLKPADFSRVPATSLLEVRGWLCSNRYLPGTGMFVIADGTRRLDLPRAYGLDRDDVASVLAKPNMHDVGYLFDVPAHTFEPGRHELQIALVAADRVGFYTLPKPLWLTFTSR